MNQRRRRRVRIRIRARRQSGTRRCVRVSQRQDCNGPAAADTHSSIVAGVTNATQCHRRQFAEHGRAQQQLVLAFVCHLGFGLRAGNGRPDLGQTADK